MLSLNPMMMFGEPGKLTPYTLKSGVLNCISYQREGRLSPRCGSLHMIGLPLFVFVPATAQLLLPLSLSGFTETGVVISSCLKVKYNESALAGGFRSSAGFNGYRLSAAGGAIG